MIQRKEKKSGFKITFYLYIIIGLFSFSGCENSENYTVVTPKIEELIEIIEVDGVVESETETQLTFQKSGKITEIKVEENQKVYQGELLASIDSDRLYIEIEQKKASLKIAQAQLNLKNAPPPKETIAISSQLIEEAKLSILHVKKKWKDMKELNNKRIEIAEQELKTIETKIKNAEIAIANIQDIGNTDMSIDEKNLKNLLENARKETIGTLDVIKNTLSFVTSVVDPADEKGKSRLVFIGAQYQYKPQFNNSYLILIEDFTQTQQAIETLLTDINKESIKEIFALLQKNGIESKKVIDMLYDMMNTSVPNINLSVQEIESLKNQINIYQNSLILQLSKIVSLEQEIEKIALIISKTENRNISQNNDVISNLDNLKNEYLLSEKNLENLKTQHQADKQAILRELEVKELLLKKAKINHEKLLAEPRAVDLAQLKANISQQESFLHQTQKDIEDTKIIAPFDGIITSINFEKGENIAASQVVMLMMSEKLQVIANIPEVDIAKIKKGDSVNIQLDALGEKKILHGKIEVIDSSQTEIQGAVYYQATISIENNGEDSHYTDIKSGMSGDVFITRNKKHTALLIPQSALEYEAGKYFVSLLKDEKIVKIPVKVGIRKKELIEIISGVSENDEIVIFTK